MTVPNNRYSATPALHHDEDELDYAYVRDVETPGLRSTFVRLVRPGTTMPASTISASADVELDLGPDGKLIGLTVHILTDEPSGWTPPDIDPVDHDSHR